MVVDDVDVDLQPGRVERLHHGEPFARRAAGRLVGRIPAIRGEITDGIVAPVVVQRGHVRRVVESVLCVVNREEFHCRDAQVFQVTRAQRGAGVGSPQMGGHGGIVLRQAAQMGLTPKSPAGMCSTMPFGAKGPVSILRNDGPDRYAVGSGCCGVTGLWLTSSA